MGVPIRVVYNFNADVLLALQEEGILSDYPVIEDVIGEREDRIVFQLFEGRDSWFVKVLPYEGAEEVIVPKVIDKDVAINIAEYLVGKEFCSGHKENCETFTGICKHGCDESVKYCIETTNIPDVECYKEFEECIEDCNEDLNKCLEQADEYYCNPARAAELYIRSQRLVPLDWFMGKEEGSRDIDWVCYFVMR